MKKMETLGDYPFASSSQILKMYYAYDRMCFVKYPLTIVVMYSMLSYYYLTFKLPRYKCLWLTNIA